MKNSKGGDHLKLAVSICELLKEYRSVTVLFPIYLKEEFKRKGGFTYTVQG